MGIRDKFQQAAELKKMRDQAMQIQRQLSAEKIEVEEGGIRVVIAGDQKIELVEINGQEERGLVGVLNKAIKKSQETAAKKLQEMGGGLSGLLGR